MSNQIEPNLGWPEHCIYMMPACCLRSMSHDFPCIFSIGKNTLELVSSS